MRELRSLEEDQHRLEAFCRVYEACFHIAFSGRPSSQADLPLPRKIGAGRPPRYDEEAYRVLRRVNKGLARYYKMMLEVLEK